MDVHGPSVASLSSRSIWSSRSVSFIVSLHEVLYFGVDFLDEIVGVDHVIVFAVYVVESGDDFLGFTKRTNCPALFGGGYLSSEPAVEFFFCVSIQCVRWLADIGFSYHLSGRLIRLVHRSSCVHGRCHCGKACSAECTALCLCYIPGCNQIGRAHV